MTVTDASVPTLGVEEEFLIVDPETGRLMPAARAVVAAARRFGVDLCPELTPVQVETNTPVCAGMQDVRAHLLAARATTAAAALEVGGCLVASGVPMAEHAEPAFTDEERYRRIGAEFGLLAAEHDVCGCHVHVAVPDRDSAVRVGNHLRLWLPTLLALTANSPIHRGVDTGYASWRSVLCGRWACSGAPPFFASAADYDARVDGLVASGAVLDRAMVYWDVRPSEHLPTVEVRVSDVPATVDGSVLLAVLVRALVMTALEAERADRPAAAVPAEVVRAAYWRAARDGITGQGLDLTTGGLVPAQRLVRDLVRHVEPALRRTGELRAVRQLLTTLLRDGNGAVLQRAAFRRRGRLTDVVAELARHTLQDCRPANVA
ncbi:glutamate--cysteine ligase [Actinophytocola sp.]|uniref:carboxylate-amine ligase n=1 Tax=Actinophytocola sp. TaxID=1872138 RepID=UPI00389AE0EF